MSQRSLERPAAAFRVLIVCTANQCRSPIAEHLLRQFTGEIGLGWVVGSAGTRARECKPMHPLAAQTLESRGIDPIGWRSQHLRPSHINQADLILTAESSHRAVVVTEVPTAVDRTFPLLQFQRLMGKVTDLDRSPTRTDRELGQDLIAAARRARSSVAPSLMGEDDLADPVGRRLKAFGRCAETIELALRSIVNQLAPDHRPVH